MASWKPVDIDYDEIEEEDDKWDDDVVNNLQKRFEGLRQFNRTSNRSYNEKIVDTTTNAKKVLERDIIELVANQMYHKLTIYFNNTRKILAIQKGKPIAKPIRNYDSLVLEDNGEISFISDDAIIDLGNSNMNGKLKPHSYVSRLGVATLKSMGFTNITMKMYGLTEINM